MLSAPLPAQFRALLMGMWVLLPSLICPAQATAPQPWETDPELVRVASLPVATNLPDVYAGFNPGSSGSGTVSFRVLIAPDGSVKEYALVGATGGLAATPFAGLLSKLKFTPAKRGGAPVPARTAVSFAWPAPSGSADEPPIDVERTLDATPTPLNHAELIAKIGYPAEAKAAGQKGRLVLKVLVDEYGRYANHVLKRTAGRLLLEAVERDIATLVFVPPFEGKKPVKAWTEVAFDFGLTP